MQINSVSIDSKTYGSIKYSVEKAGEKSFFILVDDEVTGFDAYKTEREAFSAIFDMLKSSYT